MALGINTTTHPNLQSNLHWVSIIIFIFPCAYVHAQFAMIMMHKTNTLCRACFCFGIQWTEPSVKLDNYLTASPCKWHRMTVTHWNMYGHKKGHGVAHFVCGLRYNLDSQGIRSVAGVSQLAMLWVQIRNWFLGKGNLYILYYKQFIWKGGAVQILWNNHNKPKFHSGRNLVQTEIRECLLSFGAESFVFQFAIQKYKD